MNKHSGGVEIIQKIDAYLNGKLSSREAEELWIELLKNPDYLEYLETELAVKALLLDAIQDSENPEHVAPVYSLRRAWKWLAAAATAAVVVITLDFFSVDPQPFPQQLALDEIDLTHNLAAPMVFRSQNTGLTKTDSLMNIGFQAALSGNPGRALEIYDMVIRDYDQDSVSARAYLNIGILRYNREEFSSAADAFDEALSRIRNDSSLEEQATWYLANTYTNLDNLEEARKAAHTTYALDGVFRKPADRLLLRLDLELGNIDQNEFEQRMEEY